MDTAHNYLVHRRPNKSPQKDNKQTFSPKNPRISNHTNERKNTQT